MRQVNLVNDRDEIIGQTDLLDAHRGEGKKHQAISLFLFHKKASGEFELLIQQRSNEKIVGALEWANTICANLLPEENHSACLKRRLFEELGVKWHEEWPLEKTMIFDYQVPCENGFCENEIDHIFVSVLNNQQFTTLKIEANPEEVTAVNWIDWNELKLKKVGEKKLTPWFNLFLDNSEIIKKIDRMLIK